MKHIIIFLLVITVASPCAAQWISTSMGAQVYVFGVHDTSIYLSTPGDANNPGVFRYNWGTGFYKWDETDAGIDFTQGNVTSFASLGEYFFAGQTFSNGQNAGEYSSTDIGSHWVAPKIGSPVASNGRYLFGGWGDICIARSRDSGNHWDSITNIPVSSLAALANNIFVNTGTALWRSTDTGNHWSQLSPPFVGAMTTMGSLLFIITGGSKLIESTDSGLHWDSITVDSGGAVPLDVTVLATDGNNLFAGTTTGVYLSKDTGKTWIVEDSGLGGYLNVDAMCVFDTLLFVNSSQRGGWYTAMRSIPEMTKPDTPASVVQKQTTDSLSIYPNPANGIVTIISGGISISGVSVINVLGEDVLTVSNARESEINLDISELASGTYFLLINTDGGSVTRRVVVMH
jgi:hypothetical protein